jgi:hypothetical protein
MAADRVDLVDEDDAGSVLLGLLEHVAHAAGADADEHLDEVRAGDGEERHVGLAGDGARGQGLSGAGRADQEHAARNPPAQALELLGIAQELDDLLQVFLGLVDAGNVLEGDAAMGLGEQLRLGLAEAHGLAAGALDLARHEDPQADQEEDREPLGEERHEPRNLLARRAGLDLHALVDEALREAREGRCIGLEGAAIGEVAGQLGTLDGHVADATAIGLGEELREGQVRGPGPLLRALEEREQGQQQEDDDHPQGQVAEIGVHRVSIPRVSPRTRRRSGALSVLMPDASCGITRTRPM